MVQHEPIALHRLQALQLPCRGGSCRGTLVQVPTVPNWSHALHCDVHEVLQHTPSAQNPDAQSPPVPQVNPLPSRQNPPLHM